LKIHASASMRVIFAVPLSMVAKASMVALGAMYQPLSGSSARHSAGSPIHASGDI
jgi:hypothetical protein